MRITYYVHDLTFPLREGVRKQAWWLAQAMKKRGHDVSIVCTSSQRKKIIVEGIPIAYGSALGIASLQTDVIHYISHPTPLIIPLLLRARARKQVMTLFDGYLNGFWKRPWSGLVSRLVSKKVHSITLQTEYQKKLFTSAKIDAHVHTIPPIIPSFKRKGKKSKKASLLFMTHLHPLKGIYEVLGAYDFLAPQFPGLVLTIANSGITHHSAVLQEIRRRDDKNIILKTVVDPAEELSHAWVYLYPIQSAQETFSVPLSLIESIQVKTPWISCDVGGLREYFDAPFLLPVHDVHALAACVARVLRKPSVGKLLKNINNKKTIRAFEELYEQED